MQFGQWEAEEAMARFERSAHWIAEESWNSSTKIWLKRLAAVGPA